MPFRCDIKFDRDGIGEPPPDTAVLLKWLAPEHGMLQPGTLLAELNIGGRPVWLKLSFLCALIQKCVAEGASLAPGILIAQVGADGEEIPYGRSYCTLQPRPDTSAT